MNSRRFHRAGMKKCQDEKEVVQLIGAGSNAGGTVILWHIENFARIAKILQW